jgi:hypothetical protein
MGRTTMNVEDQLAEAMRRTAGTMEPRVSDLVDEGITRGRRLRRRHRLGAAAVAAVTAAAVTAGVLTVGAGGETVTPRAPAVRLVGATEVLTRAAQVVEARPQARPRLNQWVYEKWLEAGITAQHGVKPVTSEHWMRLDWAEDAKFQHGKMSITHSKKPSVRGVRKTYEEYASFPTDPRALRAKIYQGVDAEAKRGREYRTRDGQAFNRNAQMLWSNPVTIPP